MTVRTIGYRFGRQPYRGAAFQVGVLRVHQPRKNVEIVDPYDREDQWSRKPGRNPGFLDREGVQRALPREFDPVESVGQTDGTDDPRRPMATIAVGAARGKQPPFLQPCVEPRHAGVLAALKRKRIDGPKIRGRVIVHTDRREQRCAAYSRP